MDKPVIIFGAGGLGKSALEIFESNQITVYGFLDQDQELHGSEINHVPVLGDPDDHGYLKLIGKKCEAFVATDDNDQRRDYVEKLVEGRKMMPVNAIHREAWLAPSMEIGHGNFITQKVSVGASTKIGSHCILRAGSILDYEVKVEDYVQIGAGSIVNAGVIIEKGAFIGSGVTLVSGIKIGKNARVGAGSVVIDHVKEGTTVFGNPAKEMK
jgi:sugar O-acyltransferase (sialic acid O-acetyltransferase NeuD family)